MRLPRFSFAHHRLALAVPVALALALVAAPAAAGPTPPPLTAAQQAAAAAAKDAQNAKDAANNADTALSLARAALAAANAHLARPEHTDQRAQRNHRRRQRDPAHGQHRARCRPRTPRRVHPSVIRERRHPGDARVHHLGEHHRCGDPARGAGQPDLVGKPAAGRAHRAEEQKASTTLAQHTADLAQLAAEQEQSRTEQAIIKVQTQNLLLADITAHAHVSQAQKALAQAVASLAAARARNAIYQAVPGPLFTVDTNLTLPSGETAASLNQFLNGSALAGLGASFMQAETTYHVSARYFVAHAILESGWGTSAIAQYKHNLFGFGADDANPYVDAATFPSFDACIQYVAQFIATNYLTVGGQFYHGPTLRGMNVDYASDPNWAEKIASIADTIPPLAVP